MLGKTWNEYRKCWKQLLVVDLVLKVLSYSILTPITAILFHTLLSLTGRDVLSDQDLLFLFLTPLGCLCTIAIGAVTLCIIGIEVGTLMATVVAAHYGYGAVVTSFRFAVSRSKVLLKVTARIVMRYLMVLVPHLLAAGTTFLLLLTAHDINFYLKEKPTEFWFAVAIGVVIVTSLLLSTLALATRWFYAIPVVLFEDVAPNEALRLSTERMRGQATHLAKSLIAWFLVTTAISSLATSSVLYVARFVVMQSTSSLPVLIFAVGGALLVGTIVGLCANVFSTTTFAAIYYLLYRETSPDEIQFDEIFADLSTQQSVYIKLTRRRIAITCLALAIGATAVGFFAWEFAKREDGPVLIMAHRGSSKTAPENTIAAVQQALRDGSDMVEIDVQETADGEVVVFHDADFMKLSNNPLKIWDATVDDLKTIDIGSWFDSQFKSERVPTLATVLQMCKGKAKVNIELKYYGHNVKLEERVVEIVEANNMSDEVVIMSLKLDAVKKMRALRPKWTIGLLLSVSAGNLKSTDADFLAVNAAFASRSMVRSTHAIDKQVYVWTVNDAPTMSAMIGRGVDGLITDKPALAKKVLQQRANLTVPERLLIEAATWFGLKPELGES